MKKKSLFILAIMAILLTASCSRGVRMSRELAAIDSLVDANPDSALVLLDRMDAGKENTSFRMYMELLRGKAMNKAFVNFTSDSTMLQVASYFDRHGDANQRMLAHYVLGCAYRDMGSAPRALEQYQRAVELADTTSASCDLPTLMRVHSQMADLYYRMRLVDLAEKEISNAENLAWKTGDTLSALVFDEKLCSFLLDKGKIDKGFLKAEQLYEKYLLYGYKEDAAITCINLVKACLEKKDYPDARKYIDLYETSELLSNASQKIVGGLSALHLYKGLYYKETNKPDSAEACFQKALSIGHPHRNSMLIYKELLEYYHKTNKPDSVLKYAGLYAAEKERKYNEDMGQTALQMTSLYDYSVEHKIAKEESEKAAWRKKIIVSLLTIFATIFLFAAALWYHLRRKKEDRIRNLEMELSHMLSSRQAAESQTESLVKENSEIKAAQQEIQQEIERLMEEKLRKEQMLAQEKTRNDLLIQEQSRIEKALSEERNKAELLAARETENLSVQKELREVIDEKNIRIEELERILLPSSTKEKDEQLKESPALVPFKQFFDAGKNTSPTKTEWKTLANLIEKTYPTFYSRTHSHKLISDEEYRICLLVKARFEPKEIESLLGLTYNTVSIRRKRLLKKIFDMDGGAEDFDRKILQLT